MAARSVAHEQIGRVTVLRIDHPPVNAVDLDVGRDLEHALDEALTGDGGALVVTGTSRCFSAGLDLKVIPRYGPEEQRAMVATANRVLRRLYGCPIPTVAAVNGHAVAAGLVLALTCDYRVGASGPCLVGLTEARAGIPFPSVAMAIVGAELTPSAARTMTLLARNVDGERAVTLGVLDELVPVEQVLPRAIAVAEDLASMPPGAYARIKHQLRARTIAAIAAIERDGDPMLTAWLDGDAAAASRALLDGQRGR